MTLRNSSGADWFVTYAALIVGAVLCLSAWLKMYALDAEPGAAIMLDSWTLTKALVAFELILGGSLMLQIFPKKTLIFAFFTFVMFSLVTGWKLLTGETNCNCFGVLQVHPAITLVFDIAVTCTLVMALKFSNERYKKSTRIEMPLFASWCVVSVIATALFTREQMVELEQLSNVDIKLNIADTIPTVRLTPARWIGEKLPVFRHLQCDKELDKGVWTLVFVNHRCDKCRKLARIADGFENQQTRFGKVVFVETSGLHAFGLHALSDVNWAYMAPNANWSMEIPSVVKINDGIVQTQASGKRAIKEVIGQ